MKTVSIEIDNLKCGGCANTISTSLLKFEEVFAVDVDNDASVVTLSYEETLDIELVKNKLASLGYPEKGTSTKLQEAKSYVSCAIGKMKS